MSFEQIQERVLDWANDKNLLAPDNHTKQFMKVIEEIGELSDAMLKGNKIAEEDAFGDVLVTLVILAKQRNVDLLAEFENAYNIIKARTGQTINGTFIKN